MVRGEGSGAIQAYDPTTGERKWEFRGKRSHVLGRSSDDSVGLRADRVTADFYADPPVADVDGNFYAVHAASGQLLWSTSLGGSVIVFQSDREGDLGIFWQLADGTAGPERLTKAAAGEAHVPESWHRSEDILLYSVVKGSEHVLWTYSVGEKKTAPFAGVRSGAPTAAVFSPDGKWVAYSGREVSLTTIYVQPFPPTGAMYKLVRTAGGPVVNTWSRRQTTLRREA